MVKDFAIEQIVNFRGYPQAGGALKGDIEFLWETLSIRYVMA